MFSFGGRPAVINYIWRGPGSQNSVFGKLQGYRHQIRQFVVEIRRWMSELSIPELPSPNGGNFELGNPSHPSVIYQNWIFHILGFCVLLFGTLLALSVSDHGAKRNFSTQWMYDTSCGMFLIGPFHPIRWGHVAGEERVWVFVTLPVILLQICHARVSYVGELLNFH